MEKNTTISTRIPAELAAQLDFLAEKTRRSRSWLLHEALRHYVHDEVDYVEKVQKGIDDYRAGRVVSHEEVVAELKRRRKRLS